jgi:hypothetical protein
MELDFGTDAERERSRISTIAVAIGLALSVLWIVESALHGDVVDDALSDVADVREAAGDRENVVRCGAEMGGGALVALHGFLQVLARGALTGEDQDVHVRPAEALD